MSAPVVIRDSENNQAKVVDGGLVVSEVPAPATGFETITIPFVAFMTPTGKGGDNDLTLDGSTTTVGAYIESENDGDIYIKEIKVLVTDNAALALDDFGAIASGLTNGIAPFFLNKGVKLQFADRPILTNFDLLRVGSKSPPFGADDTAWRIKGAKGGGTDYSYLSVWDMTNISPGDNGARLSAASGQRLGVDIQDDLTSLTGFEILCTGFKRFV